MNTTGPFTPGSGAAIIQRAMGGGGRHGGEGGIILPVQEVPPPDPATLALEKYPCSYSLYPLPATNQTPK